MRKQMTQDSQSQVFVAGENGSVEQQSVQLVRTNLVQLYREVCEQFQWPAGKNIRLSFFPFVDVVEVMADQAQLRKLLEILLRNAGTFSPSNSKVKVFVEKDKDKAVVRVADSGIGIPDETRSHLFDEIIGDDDSPNLHLVFDIVTAHHGTIRAEENHGGGTVFIIELPCARDVEVEEAVIIEDE
jgi:signal transduction histidine kinase